VTEARVTKNLAVKENVLGGLDHVSHGETSVDVKSSQRKSYNPWNAFLGVHDLETGQHSCQAFFRCACRQSSEDDGPFIARDPGAGPVPVQDTPARGVEAATLPSGSRMVTDRVVVWRCGQRDSRDGEIPERTKVVSHVIGGAEGEDSTLCGSEILIIYGDWERYGPEEKQGDGRTVDDALCADLVDGSQDVAGGGSSRDVLQEYLARFPEDICILSVHRAEKEQTTCFC